MEHTTKEPEKVGTHTKCGGQVFQSLFTQSDNTTEAMEQYCGKCGTFGEVKVEPVKEAVVEEVTDTEVTVQ